MDPRPLASIAMGYSDCFVDKAGVAIRIMPLDETLHQALTDMYLAYQPRDSFEGLPPIRDSACAEWVQNMIHHGVNLVAVDAGGKVLGHAALFAISRQRCEMLMAILPQAQGRGIGTRLVQSTVALAGRLDFQQIWLCVEAFNTRARHVYRNCGFRCVSAGDRGDVEMTLDVNAAPHAPHPATPGPCTADCT